MDKRLGFGLMRLPLSDPEKPAAINLEEVKKMVDVFLEAGGTYFDTAFMYHDGRSQEAVGSCLSSRYPRDAFELATKLPIGFFETREDMLRIFDEQFEKCGVDVFDRYLVHNVNAKTYPDAEKLGAFEWLAAQKKAGRIRSLGFSFHDQAPLLDKVLTEHPDMEFVQLQVNYLDWDDPAIQARACVETAHRHGKDILVMEPVRGGLLANPGPAAERILKEADSAASPVEWAFRFAASVPGVVQILSGMTTMEQLRDNLRIFASLRPVTDPEKEVLKQAVQAIRRDVAVPCTACNYCEGCPVNIPIPKYFTLYNDFKENESGFSSQRMYYENTVEQGFGRASDCIRCRRCEQHCPQHIEIADRMADVAARFETRSAE